MEYQNAGFHVSKLPYPGVEAFLNYTNHVKSISFPAPSWKKLDSELRTAVEFPLPDPYNWKQYQTWTLIELTQNYIRYMLHLLRSDPDPKAGILIHCISGWDRTPMFVSLLRLLMWAEGEAHQSLNVNQMLYLTVAYDWVLFGHQLGHRLSNRHEIIYFCFYVLQHLLSDEFSLSLGPNAPEVIALQKSKDAPSTSSSSSSSTSSTKAAENGQAHPLSEDVTPPASPPRSPMKSPSASSIASPRSPKPRPPTSEEELSDRQTERKNRLFELSTKFLQLWSDHTEPVYRK
jgi:myotubularin-related protein 14